MAVSETEPGTKQTNDASSSLLSAGRQKTQPNCSPGTRGSLTLPSAAINATAVPLHHGPLLNGRNFQVLAWLCRCFVITRSVGQRVLQLGPAYAGPLFVRFPQTASSTPHRDS